MTIAVSGGATGADELWVECAYKAGCQVEVMSFMGHRRSTPVPCKVHLVPQESLEQVLELVLSTARLLGRSVDRRPFVYNLIARNYYIVKDAQVVYAVGYLNQSKGLGVDGGTAWGCEYARKQDGVSIYFYDMCLDRWNVLCDDGWALIEHVPSPKEFERVALIGSRVLTEAGKMAIKNVWA